MDLKVAVETRPRLQACQFFIEKKEYFELKKIDNFKNSIVLCFEESKVVLEIPGASLIPDSISGLVVSTNAVCFRCQCEPNSLYGSIKTEVVPFNDLDQSSGDKYTPHINLNENCNIFCRCCLYQLSDSLSFSRILPLPTDNFDSHDLFCHDHENNTINLEPNEGDCFYGSFFIKINKSLVNLNEVIFYCNRCNSWLGTCNKNSVYLWNSSITFSNKDANKVEDTALSDFTSITKSILKTGGSNLFSKIIMYSKVDKNCTFYLLMWVIEQNLELCLSNVLLGDKIQLQPRKVIKLLYSFKKNQNSIILDFEKNVYVHKVSVSKQMISQGVKYLRTMSSYIYKDYKKANGMNVSYIEL